jgi:hypothetical protein
MHVTAPYDDDAVDLGSKVGSTGQSDIADAGPPAAASTRSLSMMHQAFGGLLTHSVGSNSPSSEPQGERARSVEDARRANRAPNAFGEERYSYESVRESDDNEFAVPKPDIRNAKGTGSTEFFDYLIAIGGV